MTGGTVGTPGGFLPGGNTGTSSGSMPVGAADPTGVPTGDALSRPAAAADWKSEMAQLVRQELQRIVKGKSNSDVNFAHFADYVGNRIIKLLLTTARDCDIDYWYIDSGASLSMSSRSSFFSNMEKVRSFTPVCLPDGSLKEVQYTGMVSLHSNFHITGCLHIPDFKFNLLSVSQVFAHNSVFFLFHHGYCLVQDSKTERIVAVGRMSHGLYLLDHSSFADATIQGYKRLLDSDVRNGRELGFAGFSIFSLWHLGLVILLNL